MGRIKPNNIQTTSLLQNNQGITLNHDTNKIKLEKISKKNTIIENKKDIWLDLTT